MFRKRLREERKCMKLRKGEWLGDNNVNNCA